MKEEKDIKKIDGRKIMIWKKQKDRQEKDEKLKELKVEKDMHKIY
jgi:hypothetical protein